MLLPALVHLLMLVSAAVLRLQTLRFLDCQGEHP